MGRFLVTGSDHLKAKGYFFIAPKHMGYKHQYDFDYVTLVKFSNQYLPLYDFKIYTEINHLL